MENEKACHCCFAGYRTSRSNSKYCSNECRSKAWRAKKEVEKIIDRYPDVKSQLSPEFLEYFLRLLLVLSEAEEDLNMLKEECNNRIQAINSGDNTPDRVIISLEIKARKTTYGYDDIMEMEYRKKYEQSIGIGIRMLIPRVRFIESFRKRHGI